MKTIRGRAGDRGPRQPRGSTGTFPFGTVGGGPPGPQAAGGIQGVSPILSARDVGAETRRSLEDVRTGLRMGAGRHQLMAVSLDGDAATQAAIRNICSHLR